MDRRPSTTNTVNNLILEANTCKYCVNCQHSYFRATPNGADYDGYCKYVGVSVGSYMHLKHIDAFDTCEHWENKKTK